MRKTMLLCILLCTAFFVFPQAVTPRLASVGIAPFEASGDGVTPNDAEEASRLIAAELSSWGTMTILEGDDAKNGEYLIQGQISWKDNQITLTVSTSDAKSGKILTNSTIQASSLKTVPLESFCEKITENVPFPNYLLGRWQSVINMVDGPVTCIMDFRSDRTIRVLRYDTWEHDGTDSLKYQAIGSGTYSYAGYRRRTVTVNNRSIQADATIGINLSLEDALPKYNFISRGGLRVLFDDTKSNFELVTAGFPCGDNYSGPSVYPSASVFYTKFAKIQ